jgi:hypothetical protein
MFGNTSFGISLASLGTVAGYIALGKFAMLYAVIASGFLMGIFSSNFI